MNKYLHLGPYNLLLFSLLFGATMYQSFVSGIVAFRALPYEQFSLLQSNIFPIYFYGQLALSLLVYATAPHQPVFGRVALVVVAISAVNSFVLLPQTRKVMEERRRQEVLDGRSCRDEVKSEEMKALNKRFGKVHGISVLLNLAGVVSLVAYGILLGGRLH